MSHVEVNDYHDIDRLYRGHSLFPKEEELAAIPKLYETEPMLFPEKVIHLKYFCGAATWWVAEYEPEKHIAFAYCDLGFGDDAEWGYVSMLELAGVLARTPQGFPLWVERDLHFAPQPWIELLAQLEGGH